MKKTILLESQYFPCLDYFAFILQHDEVVIETQENYQKQTARNRCYIKGANRIERLSIPVLKPSNTKVLSAEILMTNSLKWRQEHWRTIQSAYANTPFFAFYADPIRTELFQTHQKLFDLNMNLLKLILQLLHVSIPITYTKEYKKIPNENYSDFRGKFKYNQPYFTDYPSYFQVFGDNFTPNLSILDLLFCEGNYALSYLKKLSKSTISQK